jgi:sigma-B regulation protein RsbU (phosphoserine phosphatase)
MLLYSDGLVETANAAGEEFGESRLTASLLESIGENPHKIRDSILAALRNFLDHRSAQDDLTCVVARLATTSEPVRSDGDFVPCERKSYR